MDTEKQIFTCLDAMVRRIQTTKKTDLDIFSECDKYIKASSALIDPKRSADPSDKTFILTCQLLALELMKVVPDLLLNVQKQLTDESIVW